MLRVIITAHIGSLDANSLSLQINGKSLGVFAPEKQSNYVLSGNKDVHLIAAYYSSGSTREEADYVKAKLSLWEECFKRLQNQGLDSLGQLIRELDLEADFLLLASPALVLVWQDRSKGLYLHRAGKMYRLQPCQPAPELFPADFGNAADFFALTPQNQDLLLLLNPDFVRQFKASQLEEILTNPNQLSAVMNDLIKLGQGYGYDFDHSWLALQVQRAEENSIYRAGLNSLQGLELAKVKRAEVFVRSLMRSRALRVVHGHELIPAKAPTRSRRKQASEHIKTGADEHFNKHKLEHRSKKQAEAVIEPLDERSKQARAKTLKSYEQRREAKELILDSVRDFTFEPWKAKALAYWHRFWLIWPKQPVVSRIFATLVLLLLVLLALLFLKRRPSEEHNLPPVQPPTSVVESYVAGASAVSPSSTDLEIDLLVKAHNLQLRQAPSSSSALIATLKRGDKVKQLAPVNDSWVYIRTADGLEGYVYADYLFDAN